MTSPNDPWHNPKLVAQDRVERLITEFTRTHQLPDGRKLVYLDLGDPGGSPFFYFHGLPASRIEGIAFHDAAQDHGYRVIAADRPGIGDSAYKPGRKFLDWPADVVHLADALEFDQFGVLGISGGGPFVSVCAYAIPDRLRFAVDVAGAAPLYRDAKLSRELSAIDRVFARMGNLMPRWITDVGFRWLARKIRKMETGTQLIKLLGDQMRQPDRDVLSQEPWGAFFIRDIQHSFVQGTAGVTDEAVNLYTEWGFRYEDIACHVEVLHGADDGAVPFSFGEWKARTIPDCTFTPIEGEGHMAPGLKSDRLLTHIDQASRFQNREDRGGNT
jgi:pimeloyl-ACP methyl ester carboxylesterase